MFSVVCVRRTFLVHGLEDKGLSCVFKQQTSELIYAAERTTSENFDRAYVHRIMNFFDVEDPLSSLFHTGERESFVC